MNLNELFEIQSGLDYHIVKEKGLEGQDLLDKKILALQVELGELANEQRTWKFWSEDQRPRGEDEYLEYRTVDQGGNHWVRKNPLLEEYVDCLHFILSIGLDVKCTPVAVDVISKEVNLNVTRQFAGLFHLIASVRQDAELHKKDKTNKEELYNTYHKAFSVFLGLGELLGFAWQQIEQAYLDKNKINHERQRSGY